MSSDSDDDCYGNIAQRLQSMKNKYSEDKIETTNLLIADLKEKTDNSWRKNVSLASENDTDLSQNSEEYTLDAIIAKNSKKRTTQTSKRAASLTDEIIEPEKGTRKKRAKKSDASSSRNTTQATNTTQDNSAQTADITQSANTTQSDANSTVANSCALHSTNNSTVGETSYTRGRARGRGRASGRGRARASPRGRRRSRQSTIPGMSPRARGRQSAPHSSGLSDYWAQAMNDPAMFDFAAALAASLNSNGPVYSVGNTDEYPDQCDDQPLFNNAPKPTSDVLLIEEEDLDHNEELSVKVYWQSTEHVKFSIRRFQKLSQIFDHFAEREKVSRDKLFFTYNDKILKSDDTPDSIGYNIAKFIDGGIINQSVSSIVKNNGKDVGLKLKFQCQNVKKPIVLSIHPEDKMSFVMMRCAEHLEKPLEKLKFHFDGDLISGKQTAKELDLEEGECIDVRIIS